MVSLVSTGKEPKERTNPHTVNPAANGNTSRASVSTLISCLLSTSVSSAQARPPMFAEGVYESRRGRRLRHQAHR